MLSEMLINFKSVILITLGNFKNYQIDDPETEYWVDIKQECKFLVFFLADSIFFYKMTTKDQFCFESFEVKF